MSVKNCVADAPITPCIPSDEPSNKISFYDQFGGVKVFIEKSSAIKQLAHAWQLAGVAYINTHPIKLEGTRFVDFRKHFKKSLQDFLTTNHAIISLKETEFLSSLLNERDSKLEGEIFFKQDASLLFDDFQKEEPVSISSGFQGHRVIVAFDKDYLLIANKGAATRRPIEVYKINPEKITKAAFEEIINLADQSEETYDKWLSNISHNFDATKDSLSLCIEQAYPLSSYQEVGNCVWESLQTCVYGMLLLNRLRENFDELASSKTIALVDTSNKVFLQWREFLQIQSLERFFRANSTPSNPLPYLIANPNEESLDDLITFEGIDQNLLRNVFRQFWSTKSISIEFKEKMDKLESQYLKNLHGFALTSAKIEKLYYNQMGQIAPIVKDLAKVLAPSALSTAVVALVYTFTPEITPEFINHSGRLLVPSYSYSILRTTQLARRYFAI
ncbi:MAG: hypothetical protein Q8L98_06235 [Chlamydiales bacterium]|nr:hypothetical protein [Chlamydiales bacterium]